MTTAAVTRRSTAKRVNNLAPLYSAVQEGDLPMVRLLLKHKADVDGGVAKNGGTHEDETRRPLLHAISLGYEEVAQVLLAAGAHVTQNMRIGASSKLPGLRFD